MCLFVWLLNFHTDWMTLIFISTLPTTNAHFSYADFFPFIFSSMGAHPFLARLDIYQKWIQSINFFSPSYALNGHKNTKTQNWEWERTEKKTSIKTFVLQFFCSDTLSNERNFLLRTTLNEVMATVLYTI